MDARTMRARLGGEGRCSLTIGSVMQVQEGGVLAQTLAARHWYAYDQGGTECLGKARHGESF